MIYKPVRLTSDEIDFIGYVTSSNSFPWFIQPFQTNVKTFNASKHITGNSFFFSHTLMTRNPSEEVGLVNSQHYDFFETIFLRWINDNGLDLPCKIYRASLNLTIHNDKDMSIPHYDHYWPHWNWIMYLNGSSASTVLLDEDGKIVEEVAAKQSWACAFQKQLHAHRYPKVNEPRYVCVFTYI